MAQLILLAHGSRDARWCGTFEQGQAVINQYLAQDAELAFMEMASPSLEDVIENYSQQGVKSFQVLPLFFAEGRHLLEDVPAKITALESANPDLQIDLLDAVGRQTSFWHHLGRMIALTFGDQQDRQ